MKKLLVLLLLVSACGCAVENSSDVSQDTIYTRYAALYSADTHDITFRAYFTFGTTYLELDGTSSVSVDGKPMRAKRTIINSLYYEDIVAATTDAAYKKTYTISYVNNDGQTYENDVTLPPLVQVDLATTVVPISQPLVINWSSDEPIQNMQVTAWFVFAGSSQAGNFSVSDTVAHATSGTLTVPAAKLAELYPNNPSMQVCVSDENNAPVAPPEGGTLTVNACTAYVTLTLQQ